MAYGFREMLSYNEWKCIISKDIFGKLDLVVYPDGTITEIRVEGRYEIKTFFIML